MSYQYLLESQTISSSNFNSNMSIFYPPVAGLWTFTTSAWLGVGSNIGPFELYVVRNSSNITSGANNTTYIATTGASYNTSSSLNNISGTGTALLSTSDYVTVCIWNQSANSYTINSNDASTAWRCMFQGTLI